MSLACRYCGVEVSTTGAQMVVMPEPNATSNQIGEVLNISTSTVKVHRNNIYKKLDITGQTELIKLALQWNLSED